SRRRHTRFSRDWSSDVCSSDLPVNTLVVPHILQLPQPVVHHPEPPRPVEFGKDGQLFDDFAVILALGSVVINRSADTKQHTGLAKAQLERLTGIAHQLTLLARP